NVFFRAYIPGFRAGPQDEVPGFAVDESDGLLARPPTLTPRPPIGLPGIRVGPSDDVLALNSDDGKAPGENTWVHDGRQPEGVIPEPEAWEYPDSPRPEPLPQGPEG